MRKIIQLRVLFTSLLALLISGKLLGLTGGFYNKGPLKMALVIPANGLLPNTKAWIGWWIKRDQGWHTYWEHPGNVGLTPKLEWELPPGFTISDLQFPFPKRVQMAGVKAYGHHGETLYLAQLHIPNVPLGEKIKLTAKARWMVCSNVCLPQYGELSITIPVQDSVQPDKEWDARFSKFLSHRPFPLPEAWKLQGTGLGQFTKLSVSNVQVSNREEVYLFGRDYTVCSDSEQLLRTTESGFELLVPKPVWTEESPTHLNGLLRISAGASSIRHYLIQVPLD